LIWSNPDEDSRACRQGKSGEVTEDHLEIKKAGLSKKSVIGAELQIPLSIIF
jgi:hypothetical protein